MSVGYYRLTEAERRAVTMILERVHNMSPNQSIIAEPHVATLHRSLRQDAMATLHWLALDRCKAEIRSLEKIAECLNRGLAYERESGIVIIQNVPIIRNAPALMLIFGSMLGELIEYGDYRGAITELSDKSEAETGRPSADNSLTFPLHTDMSFYCDPPEVILMLRLSNGRHGGETVFCDVPSALDDISAPAVDALCRPFRFLPPPYRPTDPPCLFPALTALASGEMILRYRRDGIEPIENEQFSALIELETQLEAHSHVISLSPGDMVVHSNTRTLHGRKRYEDGSGTKRVSLRGYVKRRQTVL